MTGSSGHRHPLPSSQLLSSSSLQAEAEALHSSRQPHPAQRTLPCSRPRLDSDRPLREPPRQRPSHYDSFPDMQPGKALPFGCGPRSAPCLLGAKCLLSNPSLSELFFLIDIQSVSLEGVIGQVPSPFFQPFLGASGKCPRPSLSPSSGCCIHSDIKGSSGHRHPLLSSHTTFCSPLKPRQRPPPALRPRLNLRNLPVH